jgi:hypothetical protein
MHRFAFAAFSSLVAMAAVGQNQGLVLANGTTGHVDVPHSPTLAPSGGITVEAWVKYDSALGTGWRFPTIARNDPSPNQSAWFLRVEAGNTQANRMLWWVTTANGNYTLSWFYAAGTLANWTHVAATYDGAALRIFANGVQVAQGVGTGKIADLGGIVRIGGGDVSISGGETWNGELDEVRVWPFARSAAAIASTRNMRLATIPGEVTTWNLDGDAVDSSGGNHGAAFGTAAFAPNSLVLQDVPFPGLLPLGYASGCSSNGLVAAPALANLGNQGFGFVGTRAPASAPGVLAVTTAALPVPVTVLGIDVFVDLGTGVVVGVSANTLGTSDVPFAIPASSGFLGVALVSQLAWIDGACASGYSATGALISIVVP